MNPKTKDQSTKNRLVECVPNFSEGRKPEVIELIAQAIRAVDGTTVLNRHIDLDHNRSVITFVAPPEAIVEAAVRAVAKATELIDLRQHGGEHPRIGATDVLPFVPVSGVAIEDCIALAHEAGERIWRELSIPVYYYERAARRLDRERLEHVRGKGFEALREEMATNPDRKPDVGECDCTKQREQSRRRATFLIASTYLQTDDILIARRIARVVRERTVACRSLRHSDLICSRAHCAGSMNSPTTNRLDRTRVRRRAREATRLEIKVRERRSWGSSPGRLDRDAAYFPCWKTFTKTSFSRICCEVSRARATRLMRGLAQRKFRAGQPRLLCLLFLPRSRSSGPHSGWPAVGQYPGSQRSEYSSPPQAVGTSFR